MDSLTADKTRFPIFNSTRFSLFWFVPPSFTLSTKTNPSHKLYPNHPPFFFDILFLRGKRFRLRLRSSSLYYPHAQVLYRYLFLLFNDQIHGYIFFFFCKNLLREQKFSAALKEVCTPFRAVPKDQSHDRFKLIEVFYSPEGMWFFL